MSVSTILSQLESDFVLALQDDDIESIQAISKVIVHTHPTYILDVCILVACRYHRDHMVRWIINFLRSDGKYTQILSERYQSIFESICSHCKSDTAQWLVDSCPFIKFRTNYAFALACYYGNMETAKWLYSVGVDFHVITRPTSLITSNPLCNAIEGGHTEIVAWLLSLFEYPPSGEVLIRLAFNAGSVKTLQWLYSLTTYENDFNYFCRHNWGIIHDSIIQTGTPELLTFVIQLFTYYGIPLIINYNYMLLTICCHPYWTDKMLETVHILTKRGAIIKPDDQDALMTICQKCPWLRRTRLLRLYISECSPAFVDHELSIGRWIKYGEEAIAIMRGCRALENQCDTLFGRAILFAITHISRHGISILDLNILPLHIRVKYFANMNGST